MTQAQAQMSLQLFSRDRTGDSDDLKAKAGGQNSSAKTHWFIIEDEVIELNKAGCSGNTKQDIKVNTKKGNQI